VIHTHRPAPTRYTSPLSKHRSDCLLPAAATAAATTAPAPRAATATASATARSWSGTPAASPAAWRLRAQPRRAAQPRRLHACVGQGTVDVSWGSGGCVCRRHARVDQGELTRAGRALGCVHRHLRVRANQGGLLGCALRRYPHASEMQKQQGLPRSLRALGRPLHARRHPRRTSMSARMRRCSDTSTSSRLTAPPPPAGAAAL
jgi:hypothetical protein